MNLSDLTQSINTQSAPEIILVLGRLCSGKGTYCATLSADGYFHHTTSDTVKKLSGFNTRDKLSGTADLDTRIADELITIISQHPKIVIDGIRQTSIIDAIKTQYPTVQLVWLDADKDVRKSRYLRRADSKDAGGSFEDSEARDDKLGLADVEHKFKPNSKIVDYNIDYNK